MKTFRKTIALVLTLIMALTGLSLIASAATPEATLYLRATKKGEGTFAEMMAQATANSTVTLNASITVDTTYTIDKSVTVNAASGDVAITRADGFDGPLFNVTGGRLTLASVTVDGQEAESASPLLLVSSGALTLSNGAVVKNGYSTGNGGAIAAGADSETAAETTVNLETGSRIENCKASFGGAIILFNNASLFILGGVIADCEATRDAGAIDAARNGASVTMKAGEITGCKAAEWGGAISVESGAKATITGGRITGNTSASGLGAVYVDAGTTVTVGGSAYIYDNDSATGDVYLSGANNTVSLAISPAFVEGAKVGVKTQKAYGAGATTGYIRTDSDVTGYLYNNATGDSYYVVDGRVSVPNTVVVHFETEMGTIDTTERIYLVGQPYGWLPMPSIVNNASFTAWTYNGSAVYSGSIVPDAEEITLVATWKTSAKGLGFLGTFFERVGKLIQIVANFLRNLFSGTGDADIALTK